MKQGLSAWRRALAFLIFVRPFRWLKSKLSM